MTLLLINLYCSTIKKKKMDYAAKFPLLSDIPKKVNNNIHPFLV